MTVLLNSTLPNVVLEVDGGNLAVVLEALGEVNGRHTARPEFALDAISVIQRLGEAIGWRRRHGATTGDPLSKPTFGTRDVSRVRDGPYDTYG